ncbi:UNVERIFIED_CONTAM: S49 family peptidase, partial [Bacillus mycoides]
DYIGEGSMRRALEAARNDENVKAVVLRVDSPGGSALTSELIWREIELTKKVKPVVVSMGNLAASGGYYISCNANTIFAEPNTITGSIGVFGALPNFNPLATKIGINAEQVRTHKNASGYSVFEPIDENFKGYV